MEKYRRALVAKKEEISHELVKNKDAGQESSEESTQDIADKATSSYTKEFLFSLSDTERTLVQRIEQALARIDDGSYGTCTHCANPLIEKRLEAVPWTPYCLDCMELSEKGLLD
ncbi:MAG: TraR/DksA family transcriptional regulator [Thermoanaerobaculia bacterium]